MVAKLIGKISGQEVLFYKEGDNWQTVIPRDLSGEYVVELWAIDEAGNIGYAAKWLFTVDPTTLCIRLESLKYFAEYVCTDYFIDEVSQNFTAEVIYPRLVRGDMDEY